jgi:peptidyl-prolyl cis-trans isomerase D
MLQKIRDRLQGTIAKVILVLITVPFALWGIDAFFTGGVPEVARINGERITEPQLGQAIELQRRRILGQSEEKVDPQMLEESQLRTPVLDSLIQRMVLRQVAERSGLRASNALIDRMIVEDESFQESGAFSQARFQGILASNGMSPAYYKSMLREEVLISQVLGGLAASEFVTPAEVREVARLTQQTLDIRYLTVPVVADGPAPEVPAARIERYFADNPEEFRTEEMVTVDYIELRAEDLYSPVSEQELRAEYERRIASFEAATERHAAHIMLSSLEDEQAKARLQELRARIVAGEDFATLARENSEDVGSAAGGGDLGYSAGDAFPDEFEAALATLEPGEVSEPLRTDSGWHLVKLLDRRAQQAPAFDDLRAEIERALQQRAAEPLFVERSEQLADLTFNSDSLADAARELGLTVQHSTPFSRRGGEELLADSRVIAAAFSDEVLEERQNSELLELDTDHVVVLRLREHQPARQQELAEVQEKIRDLLVEAIRREQAADRAQTVLEALRAGRDVEAVATENALQWQVVLEHRRGAPGVAPELGEAAFSQPRVAGRPARSSVVLGNGDVVVFEASNLRDGDISTLPEDQQKTMRDLLAKSRGRAIASHYGEGLRALADVRML